MTNTNQVAIGIDIGGTNMRLALVTSCGEVIDRIRLQTETHMGPDALISRIVESINTLNGQAVDSGAAVTAVGMGLPGNILPDQGIVINSPNMPGWVNLDVRRALSERMPFPIVIDNDANMIALGEKWLGAAQPYDSFICLTMGTGVGGGLVLNGRIWHGKWGSGGEIGHMLLDPDGDPCSCGNPGCLESISSATGIRKRTLKFLKQGNPSILSPYLDKPGELTSQVVAEAARAGDELARSVFQEVGRFLARAIANTMYLLGLQAFLIGGGASDAWDLFYPALMAEIKDISKLFPVDQYCVKKTQLGDDAGILGAAKSAFDQVRESV